MDKEGQELTFEEIIAVLELPSVPKDKVIAAIGKMLEDGMITKDSPEHKRMQALIVKKAEEEKKDPKAKKSDKKPDKKWV